MFSETKCFVVRNTIPDKRTGDYLLIIRTVNPQGMQHVAFGLSTTDAVRAQTAGAGFILNGPEADSLITHATRGE